MYLIIFIYGSKNDHYIKIHINSIEDLVELKNMDINVLESKIFELYNKKYTPDYLYGDGLFYEKFKGFINKLISN